MDSSGTAPALRLAGLTKTFGGRPAVDHIDLEVPRGSFFGLIGPNGAGKTTSLSMAVGLLRPDSGRSEIFGVDVWTDPARAKEIIGVLPDGLSMPERLTGRELLRFTGLLRGMEVAEVERRSGELLEILALADTGRTLVMEYSTGMRKKIGLATALLHAPKLLVLDEPLEAVDPVSAATIKVILRRFVRDGGSVVFSSHVMTVVEQLCDHVAVIASGRVVASGLLETVRSGRNLEERFVDLVGGQAPEMGELAWLSS
ncbi:ABC transporter ATP-binding protein [Amycolatopsis sp. BJA-103]|uniref:ABC transporter ATP-binding protein n=1 Tax=unclassified Amycolatopsis TaxID=2618356 RepID=UPI000C75E0B3|nr:ABC transporter ATP-binding protein [Amycolatopsis sp. BJA-103]AUI60082.1 ABC transporter ATP-binding protein [Amycolatopsis sp. BJA-103]PNE14419.1 ABC transporter ATP-binding protein [Amycolatopsis sp. BJA-103]